MKKLWELKAQRSAKMEALEALAAKMDRAGYVENATDQRDWDYIRSGIAELDARISEVERIQRQTIGRAIPVPGVGDRPPLRRQSGLRAFKDTTDRHGRVVRAEDQAYGFGQLVAATAFGSQPARDFLRDSYGLTVKAQVESINSAGGVLVPDQWALQIINLKEAFGIAAKYCAKVPMNRDSLQWPRRTGGVSAFFVGEGTAPTESTATFDNINLVAKKMAALVRMSTELAEDAMVNIADWIVTEIAYAFASKEDDCLFSGDGTQTYGGMRGLSNLFATNTFGVFTATGHATFDVLTASDLIGTMGLLPQYALPGARWYCSQSFFSYVFRRLGATLGGNTIPTLANDMAYSFLGKPIVISQKLPAQGTVTGTIVAYYGDLSKAVAFGDRRQVLIKRSDERYFDTDQIGIMGTERIDIVAHDVGSTTVAGPLVALKMG